MMCGGARWLCGVTIGGNMLEWVEWWKERGPSGPPTELWRDVFALKGETPKF